MEGQIDYSTYPFKTTLTGVIVQYYHSASGQKAWVKQLFVNNT